jgi:hypothetical protein
MPLRIASTARLSGGACQITATNAPALGLSVLAATNPALPLSNWTPLGSMTEVTPGQYQFTDSQAGSIPQRFYRVCSP